MNLKQLEVFVAVAETRSFTQGAEKSYLTQSTVSQHISSLENEFGIRLLDRTGKGVYLTEGGRIFYDSACRILAGAEEMSTAIRRYKGLEQAELRIGGSNIPGIYMIPRFLPLYHEMHPGVSVHVTQGGSHEILERLMNNEIEIGFLGSLYSDEAVSFHQVAQDNIILVVDVNHRWKGIGSITLEELAEASFVFREEGSGTQGTVAAALANAGIIPTRLRVTAWLGSNEAVKQAVCRGGGVSFLSEISVRNECERRELFPVLVKGLAITRKFYSAHRRGRELSPAGRSFLNHIAQWFQDEWFLS
jgi:LysR family transcriptional regulator, low CO2-responsive transcriptional regulator